MPKFLFPLVSVVMMLFAASLPAQDTGGSEQEQSEQIQTRITTLKKRALPLVDYHIHLRGGMTAEKAFAWQEKTGIKSGVLENHGTGWPLSDNEKLAAFIKNARNYPVLVGVQVNDRDWFQKISDENRKNLDYILADTMIMALTDGGKPQKLWLEDEYKIDDPDAFFERYLKHCMIVVNEPIDILANPTYLPSPLAKNDARYWTEERMLTLIDAAIKNDVAFEIQANSEFPSEVFLKLARDRGAKFTLGRNNFNDKKEMLARPLFLLEKWDIKPENMTILPKESLR